MQRSVLLKSMKETQLSYDGVKAEWQQRHIHSDNAVFGQVCYNPGGYCGPRIQRDFQLVMLSSGSCSIMIDQTALHLQIDKVYLFTPGHRERFVFSETQKTRHFWCSVRPSLFPRDMKHALLSVSDNGLTPSECFHRMIAAAFLLRMTESKDSQQVVDLLALALFAEFLHGATHARSQTDPQILRALRYIEDHLAEENCLEEARSLSGYSETAFIYKLKAATGHTPSRLLWQLRTKKGVQLLLETGLTVSEIAYHCGFKNPFHFSRSVRGIQGVSPRMIRQAAWN